MVFKVRSFRCPITIYSMLWCILPNDHRDNWLILMSPIPFLTIYICHATYAWLQQDFCMADVLFDPAFILPPAKTFSSSKLPQYSCHPFQTTMPKAIESHEWCREYFKDHPRLNLNDPNAYSTGKPKVMCLQSATYWYRYCFSNSWGAGRSWG